MVAVRVPMNEVNQRTLEKLVKKHVDLHEANLNTTSKLSSLLIKMQSAEYMPRSLRLGISLQVPAQFRSTHSADVTEMETSISNATIAFQAACKEVFVQSITKQLAASKLSHATLYQEFLLGVLNHLKPVYDIYAAKNPSVPIAQHLRSFDALSAYVTNNWKPNTRPPFSPTSTSRFPFLIDLATLSDQYEEDLLILQLNKAFKLERERQHQREILQTAAQAMDVESNTPTVQSVNELIDQKLTGINKKLKSLTKNSGQPSSARKTNSKTKASSTAPHLAQPTQKPAPLSKSEKQNDKVGSNNSLPRNYLLLQCIKNSFSMCSTILSLSMIYLPHETPVPLLLHTWLPLMLSLRMCKPIGSLIHLGLRSHLPVPLAFLSFVI